MVLDYIACVYTPWRYGDRPDRIMGSLCLAGQVFAVLALWVDLLVWPLLVLLAILVPWLVVTFVRISCERRAAAKQIAHLLSVRNILDQGIPWDQLSPEQMDDLMVEYARFRLRK